MLKHAEINCVADVRASPCSNKHPHFNGEEMMTWLKSAGVDYDHMPALGGRRGSSSIIGPTLNEGWRNQSFHHYADYTLSEEFTDGINALLGTAECHTVAYMCSENHPARCHRLLISNRLKAHGHEVIHIIRRSEDEIKLTPHGPGKWGGCRSSRRIRRSSIRNLTDPDKKGCRQPASFSHFTVHP